MLRLTEKDWLKLRDFNKRIALRVQAKLPGDWYLTHEEVEGAVYDVFIKLLGEWRPGAMSPTSYVYQYAERRALDMLMREYRRLKNSEPVEEDFGADDDSERPGRYVEGAVKALSVDDRPARDVRDAVGEIIDKAAPEDRGAMKLYMEGRTLEEIGLKLGITKQAVSARFRKYSKGC